MRQPIVGQLYCVPHGILGVFNTILYKNEFQNPQIFPQTISLFPDHSTLFVCLFVTMRPAGTRVFANYIGTVFTKFQ
jgi:hypothetical protein